MDPWWVWLAVVPPPPEVVAEPVVAEPFSLSPWLVVSGERLSVYSRSAVPAEPWLVIPSSASLGLVGCGLSAVWRLTLVPSPEDLVPLRIPSLPGTARTQTELYPAAKSSPTQKV